MNYPSASQKKIHVLVVDDEPDNLFTFLRVLRGRYDITLASSGVEALARLAAAGDVPVNAVLVDFAMPGMDGAAFVAKLREGYPHLPCLFLTAYAEVELVKLASRQHGVSAVIMKPWQREDVERRIEHAIRIGSMRRSIRAVRG
ncbi:MAG: response regulator [Polyangiaceae bacterium]